VLDALIASVGDNTFIGHPRSTLSFQISVIRSVLGKPSMAVESASAFAGPGHDGSVESSFDVYFNPTTGTSTGIGPWVTLSEVKRAVKHVK